MNKSGVLYIIGVLALLVGGGVGLAALVAPLGVWFGAWEFGQGFGILQAINPYTRWIALVCFLDAIAILVLARVFGLKKIGKVLALPLIGGFAAGLAWYVPNSFAPGTGVPAIHDISTDVDTPPQYVAVMPLRADAPNTTVYGGAQGLQPGDNARMQQEAYPDVVPQFFNESEEEIFERVLSVANDMDWDIVASVPAEGRIEATDTTFWFRFKDDVVIRIRPENGQTRVDARSLSRVGRSDVGKNAARLREFFTRLAKY